MIETKIFGSTGHASTRTLFGAASLGSVSQEDADRTLDLLLKYGVNHIDVAASYGQGEAEKRLAPWFAKHRDKFFLATKTGERTYDAAKTELYGSLERMKTDHINLIQMHNLVETDEWDVAIGKHGALQALIEAREEGIVDYIGVTGHGFTVPRMHMKSLEQFDFASVLVPYNWLVYQHPEYRPSFDELLSVCKQKGVAFQTIKSIARRPWPGERKRACWYEPLEDQEQINKAVSWVLGNPDVFLNTVGDIDVLPRVLEAAAQFTANRHRPSDEDMQNLATEMEMELIFEGTKALSRP
jgi:aryl-alcohol dehydrogenase-like predicted oxidoreductase